MSVQIKSLSNTAPTIDTSCPAQNDSFNIIPTANAVYNLYTAANNKSAIVKSIRLVNTHATVTVKVTLYFNRPNSTGLHRRRVISPVDLSMTPGFLYVDNDEITLEPGDIIQAKADTANVIHYVISGVERDVI